MNTSRILKAYVIDGTYNVTEPITQGDYGYILQIEGIELPNIYRVDFANDRHCGEALSVYGDSNGVEVPEELIATGKNIYAFYFYLEEGFGKTTYTWKIPNDTRAKTGDREPTPTQQDSIDSAIAQMNRAVTQTGQDVVFADAFARAAAQSETNAAESARQAGLSAQSAAQSKTAAEIAQGKAEDARSAAEIAQGKAEDAKQDSETAKREAEQAAGRAEQAAQSIAPVDPTLSITGRAADAKATGDRLDTLTETVGGKQDTLTFDDAPTSGSTNPVKSGGVYAAVDEKVNKPLTNPMGTNGQLLRTLGNGQTEWVDQGLPTDEQTAQAVSDWLDEHPEATTTVEDGAVTWAKLNSAVQTEIDGKAPAVYGYLDEAYTHSVDGESKIKVMGNTFKNETVKLIDGTQVIYGRDNLTSTTVKGVTFAPDGDNVLVNGTATGDVNYIWFSSTDLMLEIPSDLLTKNLTVRVVSDKPCSLASPETGLCVYAAKYTAREGGGSKTVTGGMLFNIYNDHIEVSFNFVPGASYPYLIVLFRNLKTGDAFDNVRFFISLRETDADVVDTETTLANLESAEFDIPSGYSTVSTGVHQSALYGVLDTKKYIDDSIQGTVYDSLSALRNDSVKSGDNVSTRGYYSLGDGGGANYKVREKTNADNDNGGTIIVIGESVLEMVLDGDTVNVRTFGAKGDNATDDTTALVNAFSTGHNIFIPTGIYLLSQPLEILASHSVTMDRDAVIKLTANVSAFIMRSRSSLFGGRIDSWTFGSGYNSSVIKMVNDVSADYQHTVIRDTYLGGRAGCGTAIEICSDVSQMLYCKVDNVAAYGYQKGIYANKTNYTITGMDIKFVCNYANCVLYGEIGSSRIFLSGECGMQNDFSDYAIVLTSASYNFLFNAIIDIGNPNHIPHGVYLSNRTAFNFVTNITNAGVVVDDGFQNVKSDYLDHSPTNFWPVKNDRYNNLLINAAERLDVSVQCNNCTITANGVEYSDDLFLDSISDITPSILWEANAIDADSEFGIQIDISDLYLYPSALSYEWVPIIGYASFASGFTKIELYGRKTAEGEWVQIAVRDLESKDRAKSAYVGTSLSWFSGYKDYNQNDYLFKDVRIVLSTIKTDTYAAKAMITSLGLFGRTQGAEFRHQAFVRSDGATVYGNIDFYQGHSPIIRSPNGTAFKLIVANDGTLSATEIP